MSDLVQNLHLLVPSDPSGACIKAIETITALRAEVAWHVEDKNKWQDTQAMHLREVTRLTAEVEKLRAALDILQAAMTAKKPIPLALKKAIIEARAALSEKR